MRASIHCRQATVGATGRWTMQAFPRTMDMHPRRSAAPASRRFIALCLAAAGIGCFAPAAAAPPTSVAAVAPPAAAAALAAPAPLLILGPGDTVSVQVFGRPELAATTYVADDGTIAVPLAGSVAVGGLTPSVAARRIEAAFRAGQFLLEPEVAVLLVNYRSQQVSVLGAVNAPGRFPIESRTTVLDALAQAGGTRADGADVVVLLRPDAAGAMQRYSIDLRGLSRAAGPVPTLALRGGDSIFVPAADRFYINGAVHSPNMYRLESGMTVAHAISRGGGITQRGSSSRIEVRRRLTNGKYQTRDAQLSDSVNADDVILIKERIF